MRKLRSWLLVIGICLTAGYWLYKAIARPLLGEVVANMGRDHVTDIAGISYNSNPPTSGPHFPVWAKRGVYNRLISDGYLIHSLEHGYIVIWYDCTKQITDHWPPITIFAHDESTQESTDSGQLLKHMKVQPTSNMSWFTPENPPEVELELPDSFQSQSCKNLAAKLAEFTKVAKRVIVVPRIGMDTPIALTAWNRILKLNGVDEKAMREFIKTFENRGPEQTVE